jgi:hypothetical protein
VRGERSRVRRIGEDYLPPRRKGAKSNHPYGLTNQE